MNRQFDTSLFDQRVADWLEDDPVVAPAAVLETVLAAMPSISQRRAPARWAGIGSLPALRFGLAGGLIALVLVLLAIFSASLGGPAPSPTPVPSQTSQPTPTGLPTQVEHSPAATQSGSAALLPDAMLGAWYNAAPAFMTFIRAGDPYCVTALHTSTDCAVWKPATTPAEKAIATLADGVLSLAWKSGFCTGVTSTYTATLAGDSLTLEERPGGCQGGSYALTRAGTGSAPTAPAPPTP